jgi:uncharacterized protein (TIGR02266 family)
MERRQTQRKARRVHVKFWDTASKEPRTGYTINVSSTGLFVGTNRPLAPGTKVRLEVSFDGREVSVDGTVVHAARVSPMLQRLRPSGMGVRFDGDQPDFRQLFKTEE